MDTDTAPAAASPIDVLALIADAPAIQMRATFESEGETFDLTLALFDRARVQQIQRAVMVKEFERGGRVSEHVDDRKLRQLLTPSVLSWSGLTGRKLAVYCRKALPPVHVNGHADALAKELPCEPRTVQFLMEHALAVRPDGTRGFTDWLWEQLTGAADKLAAVEAEKKSS